MESSPRFVVVHRKDFRRLGVLGVLLGVVAGFVCRSTAIAVAADGNRGVPTHGITWQKQEQFFEVPNDR